MHRNRVLRRDQLGAVYRLGDVHRVGRVHRQNAVVELQTRHLRHLLGLSGVARVFRHHVERQGRARRGQRGDARHHPRFGAIRFRESVQSDRHKRNLLQRRADRRQHVHVRL